MLKENIKFPLSLDEIEELPDGNLKLILKEFEELKGQFVITCSWEIERLVSVGDDDEDWYWITFDGRKLIWNTCVGRIMQLKGHLRDEDYSELVRLAKLNHYDQIFPKEDFEKALQEEINAYSLKHKFLTNFCWDLE